MQQVSMEEFAGFGPSFEEEMRQKEGDDVMSAAMKILEAPEIHGPKPKSKRVAKVVSKTYDLSKTADREQYEKDVAAVINCQAGSLLLLDRPPKQFVQCDGTYKYVAYLEWAEYIDVPADENKKDDKSNKNLVQTPA